MQRLPIPDFETIHVFGVQLDWILHTVVGFIVCKFFHASGMKKSRSLLVVFAFSQLKEAIDWNADFASGDIYHSIIDTITTMLGAVLGILIRFKSKLNDNTGSGPSFDTNPAQPPLVISDKSSLSRARKIFSILRREDQKK